MTDLKQGKKPPRIIQGMNPEPLDSLPFPAYELVDFASYHRIVAGERSASVLTSRGCPHHCTFCNSNIMGAGRPIRFRSPENVIAEIRWLKSRHGIRHIRFQDDLFTFNRKRLITLAPLLASENIIYRCFSRVNGFSAEVARLLAGSGCHHVSFGVESGSPRILARHAMNKGQTPAQTRQALVNAHRAGLMTRIYLIVGFPGETDDSIKETLELIKHCPWDEFCVYPLIAYPGTPLHDQPRDFGIVSINKDYSQYLQIGRDQRAGFTIRTSNFDEHKVHGWRDYMIGELLAQGRTWAGDSAAFK